MAVILAIALLLSTSATGLRRRGIRWAVNQPSAATPWLLNNATGWANTSRTVSGATIGIVVQPVFGINITGHLTAAYPDKLLDGSLDAYAAAGHEVILAVGPWVGSLGGFVDRSGGYKGLALQGLNCSSLTSEKEASGLHFTFWTIDRFL
jgi:hypothetical protein